MSLLRAWAAVRPKHGWCSHSCVDTIAGCQRNSTSTRPLDTTRQGYHKVTHRDFKRTRVQSQLRPAGLSFSRSFPAQTRTTSDSANMASMTLQGEEKYRLPTHVQPTHYDVTIRTDLEDLTFKGFVKIRCVLYVSPFLCSCKPVVPSAYMLYGRLLRSR